MNANHTMGALNDAYIYEAVRTTGMFATVAEAKENALEILTEGVLRPGRKFWIFRLADGTFDWSIVREPRFKGVTPPTLVTSGQAS